MSLSAGEHSGESHGHIVIALCIKPLLRNETVLDVHNLCIIKHVIFTRQSRSRRIEVERCTRRFYISYKKLITACRRQEIPGPDDWWGIYSPVNIYISADTSISGIKETSSHAPRQRWEFLALVNQAGELDGILRTKAVIHKLSGGWMSLLVDFKNKANLSKYCKLSCVLRGRANFHWYCQTFKWAAPCPC